ncbi:hypothetical protein OpiT1DRAFT_04495 [Opitutaceae bacterium TAV1]|nr:hypothetical protein OpiT1DRAFT_04495 [Opitutaceae bacterium TAV1]
MRCTKCGQESDNLLTHVNLSDGKASFICVNCQVAASPEQLRLEDANREIEEWTKLKKSIEKFAARYREPDPTIPPALAAIAMTPQKALKQIEAFLRNAEQDRANILDAMPEGERLRLALAEALECENYEEAARLKQRLDEIEGGSGK